MLYTQSSSQAESLDQQYRRHLDSGDPQAAALNLLNGELRRRGPALYVSKPSRESDAR